METPYYYYNRTMKVHQSKLRGTLWQDRCAERNIIVINKSRDVCIKRCKKLEDNFKASNAFSAMRLSFATVLIGFASQAFAAPAAQVANASSVHLNKRQTFSGRVRLFTHYLNRMLIQFHTGNILLCRRGLMWHQQRQQRFRCCHQLGFIRHRGTLRPGIVFTASKRNVIE